MKLRSFLLLCAFTAMGAVAQTAKSVLDQTASVLSRGCVVANFTARGAMGNSNGNITVQGKKFVLTSPKLAFGLMVRQNGRLHKVREK